LPPIEKVAGIVLEDENIVDFGLVPNTARKTEEYQKEIGKEISCIDLDVVSMACLA
jgi:hypothetical protein